MLWALHEEASTRHQVGSNSLEVSGHTQQYSVQMACCAPETCMILVNRVTAMNSIKKKKELVLGWPPCSALASCVALSTSQPLVFTWR